ncbi:MAG: two-component system response regulator [Gammaproteobacteria bacterium]|nr:two-component system response regulator [Gammaproteobacteria bacterium]
MQSTILIVDDIPENLTLLGDILQPDYFVRVATSGLRALEVVEQPPRPDLILLDIMMEEMDGYEVMRRLQAKASTRTIPVIFISALDRHHNEQKGLELGAVDYITKPISPPIVLARVRNYLELKEHRDRLLNENSALETEVQKRIEENQVIQDVNMRALASLAETRDNETGNHILRTQHYVNLLAEWLAKHSSYSADLGAGVIRSITKAAPLHDIGKVGIPDHILLKPGALTPQEWVTMQTHTTLGSDAIVRALRGIKNQSSLAQLHLAIDIAHFHHEKWDGSGYPEGLSGEQIPLAARLMAVADVFDALITRRVYKPPFPYPKAAEIIKEGSGSHFDPTVVASFTACYPQFVEVANSFSDETEDKT